MKNIVRLFTIIIFLFSFGKSYSQMSYGGNPKSLQTKNLSMNIPLLKMEAVDNEKLLQESDAAFEIGTPLTVGIRHDVFYTMENSGRVDLLPDGGTLWRLSISSPEALAMNLHFSKFDIPENAELFIYTPNYREVLGKFTAENKMEAGDFYVQDLPGEELIVEYYEPEDAPFKGSFEITKVGHSFRDLFNIKRGAWGLEDAAPCQINTRCPEGDPWRNQINATVCVRYDVGGQQYRCTGTIMNNVKKDKKPYVLFANHCYEGNESANWYFQFFYETDACDGDAGKPYNTATGATFRAKGNAISSSDFVLMEITGAISENIKNKMFFAGWDVSPETPSVGVSIHHPRGDWKKISIPKTVKPMETSVALMNKDYYWETNWYVGAASKGFVESGSSGGPLFNAEKLVVGTVRGGSSSCDTEGYDIFGKLSRAWLNGNNTSDAAKLQPWLDPDNTGVTSLKGMNYNGEEENIPSHKETLRIEAYPNPTAGNLTVKGPFKSKIVQCSVYNVLGSLLHSSYEMPDGETIALQLGKHLSDGIYFLEIIDQDKIASVKLVISK